MYISGRKLAKLAKEKAKKKNKKNKIETNYNDKGERNKDGKNKYKEAGLKGMRTTCAGAVGKA